MRVILLQRCNISSFTSCFTYLRLWPFLNVKVNSLSRVWLFVTPWTVTCQAPPSMGFSRQEYWVGCHCLLQGIFPTQGSNLGLPHCRHTLYRLSHLSLAKNQLFILLIFDLSYCPSGQYFIYFCPDLLFLSFSNFRLPLSFSF